MPQFSIIVPVYNIENHIHRCVTSILQQTYGDYELILVDDGSTDSSKDICDEFSAADNRVKTIHKENGGVSSARNAGIDVATSPYILFVDGDDYIDSEVLDYCAKSLEASRADCFVFSYRSVHDGTNQTTDVILSPMHYSFQTDDEKVVFIEKHLMSSALGWEVWNRVYRRELIEANDIRFAEGTNYAEDLGFNILYTFHSSDLLVVDVPLYNYVLHSASMMARSRDTLRLNDSNNISVYVYQHLNRMKRSALLDSHYIVHDLIMMNELAKVSNLKHARAVGKHVLNLDHGNHFLENTDLLLKNRQVLKRIYSKGKYFLVVSRNLAIKHRVFPVYLLIQRLVLYIRECGNTRSN